MWLRIKYTHEWKLKTGIAIMLANKPWVPSGVYHIVFSGIFAIKSIQHWWCV